jgi:sugar phosphate isomerase/epimerase
MKIGIDSYCYHPYFGEIMPGETLPPQRSLEDFLNTSIKLKVNGVSLETIFMPSFEESYLNKIRDIIKKNNFDVVVAWGHPIGFDGGANRNALKDMYKQFKTCKILGTDVMRIVGSHEGWRFKPHLPQIKALSKILKEASKNAEENGIKMAMENHLDFTTDEMQMIMENVDSKYLGINYDTGNVLRIGDDPVESAKQLSKYIYAVHLKDIEPVFGANPKTWNFFASMPVGSGIIDIASVIKVLEKARYKGFYAIEIDYLHPKYNKDIDGALVKSVEYLRGLKI